MTALCDWQARPRPVRMSKGNYNIQKLSADSCRKLVRTGDACDTFLNSCAEKSEYTRELLVFVDKVADKH